MNDSSRYVLSVLVGVLVSLSTIAATGIFYLSIGVGVIVINGLIVMLRPKVWRWLLYGGRARNEGQFVVATTTSIFVILEYSDTAFEVGSIHLLTVLVVFAVGVSSGLHHQEHKE